MWSCRKVGQQTFHNINLIEACWPSSTQIFHDNMCSLLLMIHIHLFMIHIFLLLVSFSFYNCCIIGFCNKFHDTHFIICSNDDLGDKSIVQPASSALMMMTMTMMMTDLFFVIFSPQMYFWGSIFLHKKARKLWQNLPNFSKISQNFSKFPKISPHDNFFSTNIICDICE